MAKRFVVLMTAWLLLSGCGAGPLTPPPSPGSGGASPADQPCARSRSAPGYLAAQPGYRQIFFSVQFNGGRRPARLTGQEIRLYDGKRAVPIIFFAPQTAIVGILIDTSKSMSPRLGAIGAALGGFLRGLNPGDELFLVTFSDRPHLVVPLTADHRAILDQLELLHAAGHRALYDGIIKGLRVIANGCHTRKALLVITDGMDDASVSDLRQVRDEARSAGVNIYSVGIGVSDLFRSDCAGGKVACVDSKTLAALARDTGGEAFVVAGTRDPRPVTNAMGAAAAMISNHYIVGYIAPATPGGVHLVLTHHKGTVKIDAAPQF